MKIHRYLSTHPTLCGVTLELKVYGSIPCASPIGVSSADILRVQPVEVTLHSSLVSSKLGPTNRPKMLQSLNAVQTIPAPMWMLMVWHLEEATAYWSFEPKGHPVRVLESPLYRYYRHHREGELFRKNSMAIAWCCREPMTTDYMMAETFD